LEDIDIVKQVIAGADRRLNSKANKIIRMILVMLNRRRSCGFLENLQSEKWTSSLQVKWISRKDFRNHGEICQEIA